MASGAYSQLPLAFAPTLGARRGPIKRFALPALFAPAMERGLSSEASAPQVV